jgi:hypothetical protein
MPQKGSFHLTASCANGLGDDQQAGLRAVGELAAAPNCTSGKFGLRIGCDMEMDFCGWLTLGSLMPLAPAVCRLS